MKKKLKMQKTFKIILIRDIIFKILIDQSSHKQIIKKINSIKKINKKIFHILPNYLIELLENSSFKISK